MEKLLKRNEISDIDKWKVEDIYNKDEQWEKDYTEALNESQKESKYKGTLSESAVNIAEFYKKYLEEEYLAEKLYVYAFLRYYEDTTNTKYQEMSGKAQILIVKLSEKYSFADPELLAIDDEKMQLYLKEECLLEYRHSIEDLLQQKEHMLNDEQEKLLAMAGQMASSPQEIFSKFNNADVKFGVIKNENGEEVELTNGRYSVFMESTNRQVRKEAFEALYKQYKNYINTLAAVYYGNVKQAYFYSKARKYNSTIEMYLSNSFIPVSVYENLIKTVNDNLSLMHRYVETRKKALKIDELHFYDVYAPMVLDYSIKVDYESAKEMALEALKPLGEEYIMKVKEGFENGWVDVRENEGKRSGAFSWGVYGTHPYVFLNYTDTLNDVFTLVHEMGHAMHTYYSNETQPYIYSGYKIFVAEVASTCNETILIEYLLKKCTDEKERKYLINHYLEQFKGTLFRQTMFAEFEMITHKMVENGEILSAENLCNVYKDLNVKYFGKEMCIDEQIAYEWSRIPHFYTPFYVYQYATGFSAAIAIADRIIKGDETVINGYKKFLCGGGSMHPIDLLKLCGIDMNESRVIEEALKVFERLLDEFDA